jgi:hypothetical protein
VVSYGFGCCQVIIIQVQPPGVPSIGFEPATGGLKVRDQCLSPCVALSQKVLYLQVFRVYESVVTYRRVPLYVGPVVVKIVVNLFGGSGQQVYDAEPRDSNL